MLIAMAGLPGAGKSTLAIRLSRLLPATILNKDRIRSALFPPEKVEYSTAQDDFVVEIMLQTAAYLFEKDAAAQIILDGRPFGRGYQIQRLVDFSQAQAVTLELILCTCSDETARRRLERAALRGAHPAANRDFDLYQKMKATFEPIAWPHYVVNTDQPLDRCIDQCLEYLRSKPGWRQ